MIYHLTYNKKVKEVTAVLMLMCCLSCTYIDKHYDEKVLYKECQVSWPSSKKNGWCKWYTNGRLNMIANYKDDLLSGETILYYNMGIVNYRIENKDGRLWNIYEYNDHTGTPLNYGDFKNGNGNLRIYGNKTLTAEGTMINGLKEGYWKQYYDGEVLDSFEFVNGINVDFPELTFNL